jgi:3'-phosphoadenosine 5'-phosphosulfate (PAPS) 3'-phosphatase
MRLSTRSIIAEENVDSLLPTQESIIKKCIRDLNIPINELKSTLNYRGVPSKRKWQVDPIDGTKGYIENSPYSILIGLMIDSEPIVSAISCPLYDHRGFSVFKTELNQGAYASFGKEGFLTIEVSPETSIKDARVCLSRHNASEATVEFLDKLGIKQSNRLAMDGMGKFCKVAVGKYDVYLNLNRRVMFSWDYGPGDLLIREAKWHSSDIYGNRLKFDKQFCIISAPGYIFSINTLPEVILSLLE